MSEHEIQRLREELAKLDEVIKSLNGLPDAQAALKPQRDGKAKELARLEGRAPASGTHVDQSGQSGGVNMGALNKFDGPLTFGDIVGGNKISGPVIHGNVSAGRDFNAATIQTITNTETKDSLAPAPEPPLSPPAFRLTLSDQRGTALDRLVVGEEARLGLELVAAQDALPPLSMQADGAGVSWLAGQRAELRPRPDGKPPRLPHWPLVAEQAGPLDLRVLVLSGSTLLQALSMRVAVLAADDPTVLTGAAGGAARPIQRYEVIHDLAAALAAGDDALTLLFDRSSEKLRLVLLERGQSWEVELPLTDHDLNALTQAAHSKLRHLILHTPGRALTDTVELSPEVSKATLSSLAAIGAALWTGLFNPHGASSDLHALREHLRARSQQAALAITVVGHRVALPWALLYDGDPAQGVHTSSFWGLRHVVTVQPLQSRSRALPAANSLGPAAGLPALLALNLTITHRGRQVITEQRDAFAALDIVATELSSEAALREALVAGSDAALLYFYCHMRSPISSTSGPSIDMDAVAIDLTSARTAISLGDLRQAAPVTLQPRLHSGPLVLLNACSSGELTALSFGGFAPYLLDLGARAVIGTAVETPILLGAAFGPALLSAMLRDGLSAGDALRATRAQLLAEQRNPLGLLYTLYGNAALHVGKE